MVDLIVLVFCRNGLPHAGSHLLVVNRFSIFFEKFFHTRVHPSWDPSFFMDLTLTFNSILIRMARDLDFQYWAHFRVSSNPSCRKRIFITSR